MFDDELIDDIRKRSAGLPRAAQALSGGRPLLDGVTYLMPPLTLEQERASLAQLGFHPPKLLLRLWREVGNGGFGPPYGILGLEGGWWAFRKLNAVGTYFWLREEDDLEDLLPGEEPCEPLLPEGLLPICHQGCGIYICVECLKGRSEIWVFDPANDSSPLNPMGIGLYSWLDNWLRDHLT